MFTGLVESVGKIGKIQSRDGFVILTVELDDSAAGYASTLGESIAVNGCCLTVTAFDSKSMNFDVSYESLAKTNLGLLQPGSPVNLERALSMGARLGGHMVSGHVDATGTLERLEKREGGWDLFVLLPKDLGKYVIAKGSITLDGTSLTVNSVEDLPDACRLRMTLIPSTIELTSFSHLKSGWKLNVEVDLVGKYIERMLAHRLS